MSKSIIEEFKLPILGSQNVHYTDSNLINELELVSSKSDTEPIFKNLFNPKTQHGKEIMKEYSKYFTTDKRYITETQRLFSIYKPNLNLEIVNNFNNSINSIKNNVNFLKDFQYLDIKQLHFLNSNEMFLQLYSIYNISSPLISLIYPIVIFIIPFFLLKLKFKDLPFSAYKKLLIKQLENSSFGKLKFVVDNEVDAFKRLYILVTVGIYIYGIYQNIKACIKFISNFKIIKTIFLHSKEYFNYIDEEYNKLKSVVKPLKSYDMFIDSFKTHIDNIRNIRDNILKINISFKNPTSIGSSLLLLHKLNYNETLDSNMRFLNGFVGYIDCFTGLRDNINSKKIIPVTFTTKKTKMKNSYHPSIEKNIVKNNIDLNKNIILSGPNASGKTTMIKGTCINVLLSQQIGFGYYESCKLNPYQHINCYLNINDCNDKDSLFQAEARRCKNILDSMKKNKDRHFCIFDELYSGTNPDDAVNAAFKYLTYISKMKCDFIITTHYKELCEKLLNSKDILNKQMIKYKIKKGITNLSNGLNILNELNYPKELLNIV